MITAEEVSQSGRQKHLKWAWREVGRWVGEEQEGGRERGRERAPRLMFSFRLAREITPTTAAPSSAARSSGRTVSSPTKKKSMEASDENGVEMDTAEINSTNSQSVDIESNQRN